MAFSSQLSLLSSSSAVSGSAKYRSDNNLVKSPLHPKPYTEAAICRCSVKKIFLKILQNSQENTCGRVNFIKKETLAQVFSCEFCKIFKNTFFL